MAGAFGWTFLQVSMKTVCFQIKNYLRLTPFNFSMLPYPNDKILLKITLYFLLACTQAGGGGGFAPFLLKSGYVYDYVIKSSVNLTNFQIKSQDKINVFLFSSCSRLSRLTSHFSLVKVIQISVYFSSGTYIELWLLGPRPLETLR